MPTPLNHALLIMETGALTTVEIPDPTKDSVAFLQQVCDGHFETLGLGEGITAWFPEDGTGHQPTPVATLLIHDLTGALHLILGPTVITSCTHGRIVDMPNPTRQHLRHIIELTRSEHQLLSRITTATLIKAEWLS